MSFDFWLSGAIATVLFLFAEADRKRKVLHPFVVWVAVMFWFFFVPFYVIDECTPRNKGD